MSEININYKGSKIAGMDASGTKTLLTEGKYCEGNISVVYSKPAAPTPSLQTKSVSYTPTESAQTETVSADSGYDGLSQVSVSVGAISSTYVGTGITRRSSTDLTASGATVTVPSGYYSEQATKTVASGTAGTPTASKGTVSNHSISVTPSVTNSAGYISGGTKTGTAVTVSASELVSGTKSISANGTGIDVTNYASVDVAVSGGGGSFTVAHGALSNNGRTLTFSNLAHAPTAFILMLGVEYYMGEAYITDLYGEDYIVSGVYDGTNSTFYIAAFTDESAFRPYAEALASDVTWAYSGGTLSITATQAESPLYFKFAGEESYPLYTLYYL